MTVNELTLDQAINFCDILSKAHINLEELLDFSNTKSKAANMKMGLKLLNKIINEVPAVREDVYKFIQDTSNVEDASKMKLKDFKEYITEFSKNNKLSDFF